mgnify:CR=1 FL=1
MPVSIVNDQPAWHRRTSATQWAHWAGWLGLAALFVYCWQVMNRNTMWVFVQDAPRQAGDLLSRAWPPRWSYMERLWVPLWDTLNIATLGTLLGIMIAVPIAFLAARNTTPSAVLVRPIALFIIVASRSINSLIWALLLVAILGPGLLAGILTDKYQDHLPLYRQVQRFKRENIPIAPSTIEGWVRQALERLEPLYDCLLEDTRAMGYLQADETTIKVMDGTKKGACHLGYYWVYHNPLERTVLFDYQPTRGTAGAENLLKGFKGYLQTDGYATYKKLGRQEGVTHLACWAHARREYFNALGNDKKRAETALEFIQHLYAVERKAKESNLGPDAIKKLRLDASLPVINRMSEWIKEQLQDPKVLPGSAMGKALRYSAERWDELSNYLYDGRLEIDNNLVENAIRPVALGRKNYLFAGSHKAAQRSAMLYSFFAICKKHEVNPHEWLKHTLQNIMAINHNIL